MFRKNRNQSGSAVDLLGSGGEDHDPVIDLDPDEISVAPLDGNGNGNSIGSSNGNGSATAIGNGSTNGHGSANGNGSASANGSSNGLGSSNGNGSANGNGNGKHMLEHESAIAGMASSDTVAPSTTVVASTTEAPSTAPEPAAAAAVKPIEWVEPPAAGAEPPATPEAATVPGIETVEEWPISSEDPVSSEDRISPEHAATTTDPVVEPVAAADAAGAVAGGAVENETESAPQAEPVAEVTTEAEPAAEVTTETVTAPGAATGSTEPTDLDHEGSEVEDLDATPEPAVPFRTGFDEVGAGLVDLGRATLGPVRRIAPPRMKRLTDRRLGLALILVVVVFLAVLALVISAVAGLLSGPTEVVVVAARPAVITTSPGGVGSISAAPQHVSTISLNVVGVTSPISVTSVDVVAGQQVTAGQPLLQLNPLPFEQNEAQIAATLAQSQQALASARAAAAGAAASSGYLAVQVPTLAGQVALDQQLLAIAQGNATAIDSPAAGYVSNLRITPGQIVSPGTTLLQVIDPSLVVVSSGVQLSDLQSISTGDSAVITPTQLPGVHLYGKVIAVSALAPNGGLQGTVVVSAANLPGHPVPIGTQTFVSILSPVHAAVSVPSVAVLNAELNPVVATVHDNKVTFQSVQVGASNGTRTQILSGLRSGQRVAISNLQDLTNGSQVRVSSGGT